MNSKQKTKKRYLNWREALEILDDGGEINKWDESGEIQVFKKDLECHEDYFLTQNSLSALIMRNLIKQVPRAALKAETWVGRITTPHPTTLQN